MDINKFEERLNECRVEFHPVVPFRQTDKLLRLDFTAKNTALTPEVLSNTNLFSEYINKQLQQASAAYGIGGYNEHRTIYSRSEVFDGVSGEEGRRLHLGVDIWGPVDTPIYAPLAGTVHSVGFNDAYGDYGATLILQHEIKGLLFHTLYGHLSLKSIQDKQEGQAVEKGAWIASFGDISENGNWPPHLHFQLILDMQGNKGDYPGVCRFSERQGYLNNCPDPDLILRMNRFVF